MSSDLDYQWQRFANYLAVGTLGKEQLWEDFGKSINTNELVDEDVEELPW